MGPRRDALRRRARPAGRRPRLLGDGAGDGVERGAGEWVERKRERGGTRRSPPLDSKTPKRTHRSPPPPLPPQLGPDRVLPFPASARVGLRLVQALATGRAHRAAADRLDRAAAELADLAPSVAAAHAEAVASVKAQVCERKREARKEGALFFFLLTPPPPPPPPPPPSTPQLLRLCIVTAAARVASGEPLDAAVAAECGTGVPAASVEALASDEGALSAALSAAHADSDAAATAAGALAQAVSGALGALAIDVLLDLKETALTGGNGGGRTPTAVAPAPLPARRGPAAAAAAAAGDVARWSSDDEGDAPPPARRARRATAPARGAPADRLTSRGRTRRATNRWSDEEVETLVRLVQEHGEGRWTAILTAGGGTFSSRARTAVDLKDKWRNLARASERAREAPTRPALNIILM